MPTIAASLYAELLAAPGTDKPGLTLRYATALLDAGRAAEAEEALNASPGNRPPEWRLRMGLALAQQKRFDGARDQIERINVDQLTLPDRAWFWFLQGVLADAATPRDVPRANKNYQNAEQDAPNDFARANFLAAEQRTRLTLVPYTPAELDQLRRAYEAEQQRGRPAYQLAEDYAVRLDALKQTNEAVKFLGDTIVRIPRAESTWTDRLRFLLGMVGDRTRGGAGRNALNLLLEQGQTADLQREALQILAGSSQRDPERTLFRAELDKLLAPEAKSPIRDGLLLMRAQLALAEKDYLTAERRANELNETFPGSALRPHAFVVLASSAWEQRRYRLAAENARRAREAVVAQPVAKPQFEAKVVAQIVGELRVFEAEARYRARDYRLAAEAYAAALQQPPANVNAGDLMFQRALASILADENDPKADLPKIVDELEADPQFDATNRWEAEWSLARGLKVQGKVQVALDRVTRLLEHAADAKISPDLRARMSWLQLSLALDAGHPELALRLAPNLAAVLSGTSAELSNEAASSAALAIARAQFDLNQEAAALDTLKALRAQYPTSKAAIFSYLQTADYYAGREKLQDALQALGQLIDAPAYQRSEYVPYALFRRAGLLERRALAQQSGQREDLEEANKAIEKLVDEKRDPPAPADLVFMARLKQGDLLRTLNDFPRAQVAYEDLMNNSKYVQADDISGRSLAELKLAECHNAQSSTDVSGSHADQAQSMFEELLYRVSAPADVRVEAGYNLGKILERRGQFEKARDVWWRDVITPFLIDATSGESSRATVPYWLARTLIDIGQLLEQRQNTDEARRAYVLLRDSHLGYGESVALERLAKLGISGAPAPASGAENASAKLSNPKQG